ncbi:MAG: hypothetical protein A3A94_03155 [Candidatus Portnoybacteria bacterium RIFCSPLOWO2_01_FULL_43_11]|uniref:EamA domain-containing protein n=2 Tax=Candidatus Portnoyibacteriota TaxID=1817913 RepID=A0A1G2FNX1_9BACT|nr:MAG: hypothetical protein A3D38_01800 [Candidatus Portnoybacteria bacterium RIFCSPHIGHO2_02_FULL_40_23]OGZ38251.1 MAG: hypothetical protein A3A94_03155 [Candidatus Portnoybacteria bacterium RIFCSPLOWO2_01_FULL_43_11]OGZ39221.1 MAG: hypothetical protein A3E90_03070 [Candidatus Portnoybacteria bacterium RIFCSPHIGHO2_12_FULL_40_11]
MNEKKGIFLILGTALISGVSIYINQFGVSVINPYIFTGLKNIIAAGLLFLAIFSFKEWLTLKKLNKKQWLTLIVIGLIGGSIPFLLFFKGLSLSTGAEASFIHKTMFVFVAFLAFLFLKEKISKSLILGISFLVLGNALFLKIGLNSVWDKGDLLILIATLFWAGEQIISKKALSTISPRILGWGRMFFGFLFIAVFWLITGQFQSVAALNLNQIGWVLITAVLLFGYVLTWYSGLKYVRVSVAACVLALGAPITTLLTLFQGKSLTIFEVGGILLISLGIILVIDIFKKISYFKNLKVERV